MRSLQPLRAADVPMRQITLAQSAWSTHHHWTSSTLLDYKVCLLLFICLLLNLLACEGGIWDNYAASVAQKQQISVARMANSEPDWSSKLSFTLVCV